jgi:hypothetical protein
MGNRTKRAIRLAAPLALGVAAAIVAAVSSDRIVALDHLLALSWLPGVVLSLLLLGAAAGIALALPRSKPLSGEPTVPEPVIRRPTIPEVRRKPAIISVHGLEAQAGCTSIVFNLAVELAAAGLVDGRRPRPICVVRAGPLSTTVGLDPQPFTDYCRSHLAAVGDEVIELAERHPSGCEVLCVADGVLDGHRLRLLSSVLRRFYDVILLDCPPGDRWLTDSAFDASEVSLLVGLPTEESAKGVLPWSDTSWRYGLDARFGLIVNRVSARTSIPELLPAAFANLALIPEDPGAGNALELPWVLRPESRAGRAISELAARLMPDLAAKDSSHAA